MQTNTETTTHLPVTSLFSVIRTNSNDEKNKWVCISK